MYLQYISRGVEESQETDTVCISHSINLGDLVDSSTVYNSLSSTGEVRKNIGKFVTVEPMGEKLDSELCIRALV